MRTGSSFVLAALILSSRLAFGSAGPSCGTVQITIKDESGDVVSQAPVFIYDAKGKHVIGGKDVEGTALLSLKAGAYAFSTAVARPTGDALIRYASPLARVTIAAGDNTVIILTLKPVKETPLPVSPAVFKRMSLPANAMAYLQQAEQL